MRELVFPVEILLDKEKWEGPPSREEEVRQKIILTGPEPGEDLLVTQRGSRDKRGVLFWVESRRTKELISSPEEIWERMKKTHSFWILGGFRCDTVEEFNEIAPHQNNKE